MHQLTASEASNSQREDFEVWFKPKKIAMQKQGISMLRIIKLHQRQWEAWQAALKSKQGEV